MNIGVFILPSIVIAAVVVGVVVVVRRAHVGAQSLREHLVVVGVVCIGLYVVSALVWTSGVRSKDWMDGRIYAEGNDTIVDIAGSEVVLENTEWPGDSASFRMQVAGWTGSAALVSSGETPGSPVFTYVNYNGNGQTVLTVGEKKLYLQLCGAEIFVGEKLPLKVGERLRIR